MTVALLMRAPSGGSDFFPGGQIPFWEFYQQIAEDECAYGYDGTEQQGLLLGVRID